YDLPPALHEYLMKYPAVPLDGARDVLYWSKETIPRLHPTITLTHMVVYTPPGASPVVARKLIYADHYFEGAFELLSVVNAPDVPDGPAMYLIDVRRYRFDHLPSGGILNIRGRVRNHLADLLRSDLEHERSAIEPSHAK
ncbi:MAG TPA: hypothetical protein VHV78_13225, partial [Gemmatimonadaceae bacterium]|nr:hypothetical protein [Gemmatimonadaceae bacterium]